MELNARFHSPKHCSNIEPNKTSLINLHKIMSLFTTVDTPPFPFDINHKHKLMFIGSCFADNIGQRFLNYKFNIQINPYGVLYNPASICQCLNAILDNKFDSSKLIQHDEMWHSFLHHSSFSNVDKKTCLFTINEQTGRSYSFIKETDFLFITFGTANVYEYQGNIVSNCHKLPSKSFTRRRLGINEIVETVTNTIHKLQNINSKLKIIYTVSPVRYAKDSMHENSLSKAALHLAIEQLCQLKNSYYYPAYEIIIDELRDYRFFAEDMAHPNNTAVSILWERLNNSFFTPDTQTLCKQIQNIISASQHRPFNKETGAYQQFLSSMLKKALDLQSRHSELDLTQEITYFSKK